MRRFVVYFLTAAGLLVSAANSLMCQPREGIAVAQLFENDSISIVADAAKIAAAFEMHWTDWKYEPAVNIIGNPGFGFYAVFSAFAIQNGQRVHQAFQLSSGYAEDGNQMLYLPVASSIDQMQCTPIDCADDQCLPQVIDGSLVCDPSCTTGGNCVKSAFIIPRIDEWTETITYLRENTKLLHMFVQGAK